MAVNKDLDQQILKRQAELRGDDAQGLERSKQINEKITTILENKVGEVQTKVPVFWLPLIIDVVIMCIMGTVLHFNGGKFWLMLILSAVILIAEYVLYTVWRKTRLDKNYSEISDIKQQITEIQKKFTPVYRTFTDKKTDLIKEIDGFVQEDSDGEEKYRILKDDQGDLLIREVYDRGGFLHYQLVYELTGELAQVREFSISRAGYLLTTYKDREVKERLFCGESGESFSLEKYNNFYRVPEKVDSVRQKYANIISAKLKQVDKIKDGAPTSTYNWYKQTKLSTSAAVDSLRQAEYIGRQQEEQEGRENRLMHDLSTDNLTGVDLINKLFTSYNSEVSELYSKIDILRQPDETIYKKMMDLQWYLRPVEVFAGSSKSDAYSKLSSLLAGAAGEEEVVKHLENDASVKLLNNLTLPAPDGSMVKIDHVAITPAGIFLIEAKARALEEGRIYRAKNEPDKATIRKQISLHKDAVYQQLKQMAKGLFSDQVIEKVLRADAIRSLLVIVNRTAPEKQDFLIDNPNYYREYNRTSIVTLDELDHAVHRDTADLSLTEQNVIQLTRALEADSHSYTEMQLNYEFFPYLEEYSGQELNQQIWNQLRSIEELEEILNGLNSAVDELIDFEKQYQKYSSLAAILPYFTTQLTGEEFDLTGKIGLSVDELSDVIGNEEKLLNTTEHNVDSLVLEYSDRIKNLQNIEDGKLDAVVPVAVAVVISTLLGTMMM